MQQFSSRPPVDVLYDIFLLKKRKDKGEVIDLPLLTIMLHNKQAFSGFLMDLKKENSGVYHLSVELQGSSDLFFVEAYYIQGVVVHEIEKIDYLLSDIKNTPTVSTVTSLQIKSKLSDASGTLTSFFGKPMEFNSDEGSLDPKDLYYVKHVISDIMMCLLFIGDDDIGKSAITDGVDKIVLRKGNDLLVKREGKALVFSDTFARSYSTNMQRANLQQALVEVL